MADKTTKLFAQMECYGEDGKKFDKGALVATVTSSVSIERIHNLLSGGRLGETAPAPEPVTANPSGPVAQATSPKPTA